ncbi:MAG: biotin--[acetyl-CoA-carboxylase] ligase [Xanthomonadaceae bacterium]|nr:biotin--[acetyl-CoA-carboxylase] ligase [Xanthomonadaceae bacterium]
MLPLVDALAAGDWLSGEALAQAAGVTRAALAKRISQIEAWGLDIEARPGLGYRLSTPLERLDAARIGALPPLRKVAVALRVDSTNQRLIEVPSADDPQALFAEAQTAGRGRRGRDWRSPFGANLYLSLAWNFGGWPPKLGCLPLAVGVAATRALSAAGLDGVQLKWPNDLRIGDAKLGGILIESRSEIGGACRVVIGLGLNVAMTAAQAADLGQPWISVHAAQDAAGRPRVTRNALAGHLLAALSAALTDFEASGFARFLDDWKRLDLAADQPVRIIGAGAAELDGIARGIDDDGALIVETPDGRRQHLHAGEVSLRLAPASA